MLVKKKVKHLYLLFYPTYNIYIILCNILPSYATVSGMSWDFELSGWLDDTTIYLGCKTPTVHHESKKLGEPNMGIGTFQIVPSKNQNDWCSSLKQHGHSCGTIYFFTHLQWILSKRMQEVLATQPAGKIIPINHIHLAVSSSSNPNPGIQRHSSKTAEVHMYIYIYV